MHIPVCKFKYVMIPRCIKNVYSFEPPHSEFATTFNFSTSVYNQNNSLSAMALDANHSIY